MKILKGISAAPGIARGPVCIYTAGTGREVPQYTIAPRDVPAELKRLRAAIDATAREMRKMIAAAGSRFDKKAAEIFAAHLAIICDPSLFRKIADRIESRLMNAEHALVDTFESYLKQYTHAEGHFKELAHDLVDTRDRLLEGFLPEAGGFKCEVGEKQPVIVAASRLTPSMVLNVPRENVLAFVTQEGGFTSHATILARTYGVPIIFGIDIDKELDCGFNVIVNGSQGTVIVSPDKKMREHYARRIAVLEKRKGVCDQRKEQTTRTGSGQRVMMKVNISTPEEFSLIRGLPHDGIGLLRTEFLFLRRDEPPSEEEQYQVYRRILEEDARKPVAVRLLDLGLDKMPAFMRNAEIAAAEQGLRGAAVAEEFPDIYISQAKALLRANSYGNLQLIYPMVSDVNDLMIFKRIVARAKAMLSREKAAFNGHFTEGVMIETPAAVMLTDELLQNVDFVNIGSNDLLQYTLAVTRGNRIEEERYHILHPALMRMMEIIVKAGRKARKEVCLCGEIASFEEFYPLLLALGLTCFSVGIPQFNDIKCALLHVRQPDGRKILNDYYKAESKKDVERQIARL
jgi:phosphoenolpyruvate-protein phosphotransferase